MKRRRGRFSGIGWVLRRDPVKARRMMIDAIVDSEGVLVRAAHRLGVSRMALWGWAYDLGLWRTINTARIRRVQQETYKRMRVQALERRQARRAEAVMRELDRAERRKRERRQAWARVESEGTER